MFLFLKQTQKIADDIILTDVNHDLIQCYVQVRDNVEGVIEYLRGYKNEKDFYYQIRELVPGNEVEKAAQVIFLNRTSFNGIYRVNLKGTYNVPYGFKQYATLFDFDNLRSVSKLLFGTKIATTDFEISLKGVKTNDLVFLDPPYTVAHGNNGFVKYNQKIFAWQDQERLASTVKMIVENDAHFILTNAGHSSIDSLFSETGEKTEIGRYSVIGGTKAKRDVINEYIFFNRGSRGNSI